MTGRRGRKTWPQQEPDGTEEVFFVEHGVKENLDALMCPTRGSCAVHPSADSDTHASLSDAADIVMRENVFALNVSASSLFDLTGARSIEMLEKTHPLPDSNNSSAHIWHETTTSSRAKVRPAGAMLALDLNPKRHNSCVTRGPVGAVKNSSHP